MRRFISIIITVILAFGLFGCSGRTLLDPNSPVTLSFWHVYGE